MWEVYLEGILRYKNVDRKLPLYKLQRLLNNYKIYVIYHEDKDDKRMCCFYSV